MIFANKSDEKRFGKKEGIILVALYVVMLIVVRISFLS